jgi:preprotein translocase subunit SecA
MKKIAAAATCVLLALAPARAADFALETLPAAESASAPIGALAAPGAAALVSPPALFAAPLPAPAPPLFAAPAAAPAPAASAAAAATLSAAAAPLSEPSAAPALPSRAAPDAPDASAAPDAADASALFDGARRGERRFWAPLAAVALLHPASSTFHELGHYLASRAVGRRAVLRIDKVLVSDMDSLSYPERLLISLAGPGFNFLLAAAAAVAAFAAAGPWPIILAAYAGLNVFFGATNLVPNRPSFLARAAGESGVSDGAHAREEWRAWRAARSAPGTWDWNELAGDDRRVSAAEESGPSLDERLAGLVAPDADRAAIADAVRAADALAPRFAALSPEELRGATAALRRRRKSGESLDALAPEALAAAREACARALGKRPYAEQLMAAAALHRGLVVEQKTGEGKTLAIGMAAYLDALDGPVDVHTFNSYLAVRDAAEIGRPLALLGLKVGALDGRSEAYLFSGRRDSPRHAEEQALVRLSARALFDEADVVYGHTNAFIFTELFDQDAAARSATARASRPKRFALVDEADAAMMEEANNDFRIVAKAPRDAVDYRFLYGLTAAWKPGEDFAVDERDRSVLLLPKAVEFLAALRAADPSLPGADRLEVYARSALKARLVLKLDRDYAVVQDEIVILDAHTGRLLHGRTWEDGLSRFVEIKEGLKTEGDDRLSSHMSLDAYFGLYDKAAGVTGTLAGADAEFEAVFGLRAARVPPHRPSRRVDRPDRLFRTRDAKLDALLADALAAGRAGRPVLIGAQDVAESALLARRLDAAGEKYGLLNGLQSDESAVVARAGLPGALTVATQLAGRGTDIKLDARARDAGGLLVLLTTMSDSPRVDLQYRGRAGRQGDPGESRLYVSLEDEVLARRATDAERDALAASLSADGADASPAADALLREIQRRAERDDAALRASLRGRDRVLAPSRARYFARRALWRALPLPFKSAVLTALHVGWGDFLAAHEDAWRGGGPGPSAEETARLFETRTLRPALAALLPQKLAAAAVRAAGSAVAEFFRDTFYARAFSWAARRTVAPAAGFVFAQAGRVLAAARLRAAAAAMMRRALALRPDDWRTRQRLAAAYFALGRHSEAAREFQALLESFWRRRQQFTSAQRSVMEKAIENMAVSLTARAEGAEAAARARDLNLAFELDPTDARRRAAVASLKPLTTAQREAVQTMPPYMDLVYLDMARTAIDAANYKNAKNYFSRVIAMDPSLVTAYAGRAYANRQLGETAAAADDIFAALRLRLLGTRQFENMRLVYSRRAGVSLDAARLDEAFAALRAGETAAEPPAAGEEAAEQARSQWRSGRARLNAGDARGAVAWFDRALSRDPRFARAYDDRGIARSRLGDLRGAYEDFADSLLWEVLDGGTWNNLIVGHTTRAQWTPAPGALAAFVARLKRL